MEVKPSPDHKAILVGVVRRAMIHQNLPLSLSKRICQVSAAVSFNGGTSHCLASNADF